MSIADTQDRAVPAPAERTRRSAGAARYLAFLVALLGSAALLVVGICWAVSIGTEEIALRDIFGSVFSYDETSAQEAIVRLIRLPRVMLAAVVGACLGVAGVILQGLTRNPLGAPEILGVNAGAAFAVGTTTALWRSLDVPVVWLGFLGATGAMSLVFLMAYFSRGGMNPVRLALAGVTVSVLLLSIMQGVLLLDIETAQDIYFWLVGGVNYGSWADVRTILPWLVLGTVLSFLLAGRLNVLALGEDVARGLGMNVARTRVMGAVAVILLAGSAVGVAGPVTFIGLIVPHIVRRLVGVNHYRVLPVSAVLGAALFVYADIASRYVNAPFETPAGVVTGLGGAPVLISLARRTWLARG